MDKAMSKDKISSQEMVDLVASKLSVSKRVAEEFLKSLFAEIEEALLKGEPVKVKNLGTFKMQWNEPRKSVNVQTGEVFVIEGYNKVTFTPDSELKEAVNEPYSHLEPVELDGEMPDFEIEKPVTGVGDTLKNLSEQASEIKDILSEINALSTKKTAKPVVKEELKEVEAEITTPIEIPDYDLILLDEDTEEQTAEEESLVEVAKVTEPEVVVPPSDDKPEELIVENPVQKEDEADEVIEPVFDEPVIAQPVVEQAPVITDTKKENEMENTEEIPEKSSSPFILGKKKKRKGLRFTIWLIVVLAIVGGAVYAVYFSSSCFRCWVEYDLFSETNRQKISEYTNTFKGWFSSDKKPANSNTSENDTVAKITLPADVANTGDTVTETAAQTAPKDSLQMLFDSHREYHEFLGEEEIGEGTRLTTIAQRYYGKKDFWVYIYEANRDNIVHPDRITPGTIVKIPKVDPRLIDKKNPRCIAKAKELHDLYVGKK